MNDDSNNCTDPKSIVNENNSTRDKNKDINNDKISDNHNTNENS